MIGGDVMASNRLKPDLALTSSVATKRSSDNYDKLAAYVPGRSAAGRVVWIR
jgi:hypothetical protein